MGARDNLTSLSSVSRDVSGDRRDVDSRQVNPVHQVSCL